MFGMVKHITIVNPAALWMKYYQYDIKLQKINQSLNNMNALRFHTTPPPLCISLVGGSRGFLLGFQFQFFTIQEMSDSPWKISPMVKKIGPPCKNFPDLPLSYQLFTALRIFWCTQVTNNICIYICILIYLNILFHF